MDKRGHETCKGWRREEKQPGCLFFFLQSIINLDSQSIDTDPDYGKYVYDSDTGWIYGTQADMISLGGLDGANYTGNFNYMIDYRPEVTVLSRTGAADP